jgi:hypothetical protein
VKADDAEEEMYAMCVQSLESMALLYSDYPVHVAANVAEASVPQWPSMNLTL